MTATANVAAIPAHIPNTIKSVWSRGSFGSGAYSSDATVVKVNSVCGKPSRRAVQTPFSQAGATDEFFICSGDAISISSVPNCAQHAAGDSRYAYVCISASCIRVINGYAGAVTEFATDAFAGTRSEYEYQNIKSFSSEANASHGFASAFVYCFGRVGDIEGETFADDCERAFSDGDYGRDCRAAPRVWRGVCARPIGGRRHCDRCARD